VEIPIGRRERKKAQTRDALVTAATQLFLARGYDAVTIAEIAETADTAVTTLFKHFPDGKESLVFGDADPEPNRGAALATAIRERPSGSRILDVIEEFIAARGPFLANPDSELAARLRLIMETPALRSYARQQWHSAGSAVIAEIAAATGRSADDAGLHAVVRFALETPDIAGTRSSNDARRALHAIFEHLRSGWPDL
jgi:AcrR family transcriptional regulator